MADRRITTPDMRPFWRYFGGKWKMAPRYPRPKYKTITEPFCGAAGYSMRYADHDVILVDAYPVIAGIWKYLISVSSSEILRIPLVDHVDDLPTWVPVEARWLVGFNLNAAAASPCKSISKGRVQYREAGRKFEGWSQAQRESVAYQAQKIKHWKVFERNYLDAPNKQATYFIDPPYHKSGKHYAKSSTNIDFSALGDWSKAPKRSSFSLRTSRC